MPKTDLTTKVKDVFDLLNLSANMEIQYGPTRIRFPSIRVDLDITEFHDSEGDFSVAATFKGDGVSSISTGTTLLGTVISALINIILHIKSTNNYPELEDDLRSVVKTYRSLLEHHVKTSREQAEYQLKRWEESFAQAQAYETEAKTIFESLAGPYVQRTPEERRASLRVAFDRLKT